MDISQNKEDLIVPKKAFLSERIFRQWNRLSREVMQSPFLGLSKILIQLDQALASWSDLRAGSVLSRTLDLDNVLRFLLT